MQDKEPAKAVAPQQGLRKPSRAGAAGKRRLTEARTPHLRTSKRVRTTAAAVAPPVYLVLAFSSQLLLTD